MTQNGNGFSGFGGHTPPVDSGLSGFATSLAGAPKTFSLDKKDLADWVQDWVIRGKCVLFILCHDEEDRGEPRRAVTQVSIPKKTLEPERSEIIERLCNEFDRSSRVLAATHVKERRFFVGAHPTENKDVHALAEYPFMVSPPPEVRASMYQDENRETNATAVVGHLQRLVDKMAGLLSSNLQADKDRLVQEKGDLMVHMSRLIEANFNMAQQREQALDQQQSRQLAADEARFNMQAKQQLLNGLMTYGFNFAKALVDNRESRVLGGIRSLDQDEIMSLMFTIDQFPPEKKKKFSPIFVTVLKEMEPDNLFQVIKIVNEMPKEKREFFDPIFEEVVGSLSAEKQQALTGVINREIEARKDEADVKKDGDK